MFIYGLFSTENENKIKYVGRTKYKLSKRLKEHVNGALLRNCKTYKDNWIRKVYNDGYEVKIKLIEECDDSIWEDREKYWIKKITDITNLTDGGDGGHGRLYHVSYNDMKNYISSLPFKLKNLDDFKQFSKKIDKNYPKNPYEYFKNKGEWISWGDFLGTNRVQDNIKTRNYLSYDEAKRYLKNKKFRYLKEYHDFIKNENIDFLPYKPDRFYKNKNRGWKSWMDYLGTVKSYEISNDLLFRYFKRFHPYITGGWTFKKYKNRIHRAIRYEFIKNFDFSKIRNQSK